MDLDNDGHQDVLTGSWPGELFWFRGKGSGEYEKSVMLKDANDKFICIGGGIDESDDGILITGHAEFEETDEGENYVIYHGKRIDSTMEKPVSVTGTASVVHAVDWDDDGDFDLLVGDIDGNVFLVPNEGNANEFKFVKHKKVKCENSKSIKIKGGDAGPVTTDWDGDGDLDLIVACGNGSVQLYRNEGTRREPKLAEAEELISKGEDVWRGEDAPRKPTRGLRAKVCVTDYNGDGRPDILLGDYAVLGHDPPELSDEEEKEHAELEEERSSLNRKYRELIETFKGSTRTKNKDEAKAASDELKALRDRLTEIAKSLPKKTTTHGWVWVFTQKPVEEDSAKADAEDSE